MGKSRTGYFASRSVDAYGSLDQGSGFCVKKLKILAAAPCRIDRHRKIAHETEPLPLIPKQDSKNLRGFRAFSSNSRRAEYKSRLVWV